MIIADPQQPDALITIFIIDRSPVGSNAILLKKVIYFKNGTLSIIHLLVVYS